MIQFISHHTERYDYLNGIRLALRGGIRWIQLRMKETSDASFLETGKEVRKLCSRCGATFIIDDRAWLVRETGADGVHLGRNDMPVREARKMLGRDAIIGGTANTFEDIETLCRASADYIGCGPFRFTTTKKELSPVLGLEGFRGIMQRVREAGITVPVVAIGGITRDDIPALLGTGVRGIALSGAVLRAEKPIEEIRKICQTINNSTSGSWKIEEDIGR
mgnify:CR=1 FL=1